MAQDLRLYSLSLLIVLMLWTSPVRADYGAGSTCPALAVPVQLTGEDVWTDTNRDLYPASGTVVNVTQPRDADNNEYRDCRLSAGAGSYYDGGNHLWVLDDNLTCNFNGSDGGDFRAGYDY